MAYHAIQWRVATVVFTIVDYSVEHEFGYFTWIHPATLKHMCRIAFKSITANEPPAYEVLKNRVSLNLMTEIQS